MRSPPAIEWRDDTVFILDQRQLPDVVEIIRCDGYPAVNEAIRTLAIRGAPALGVAAAYTIALGAVHLKASTADEFLRALDAIVDEVVATRPTAVNLPWAAKRMRHAAREAADRGVDGLRHALVAEAHAIAADNEHRHRRLAAVGVELFASGDRVLHHCNTGPLATAALHGTALGVLQEAHARLGVSVWVAETRPLLQGGRLTAWELEQWGVPYTLITDSMAGHFMQRGDVDKVIVGADRIAANGDVANKIGTYSLAVLAQAHAVPFYVAAPFSTVDFDVSSGDQIPIEQRAPEEVRGYAGIRWAPADAEVANPAFDVTPARLVGAIVTEQGIARPPYAASLVDLFRRAPATV